MDFNLYRSPPNMAFRNYLIYSDLMKQLSGAQPSEMAVSLASSAPSPASAPSPLKRHLDHSLTHGAITDLNNPDFRLLSDSLAGKMSSRLVNGAIVIEPIAKRPKLDMSPCKATDSLMLNNNATDIISSRKNASIESLKNGIKMLVSSNDNDKAYSCGWMGNNTSPMRHPESGDAHPDSPQQPPTLNPVSPPSTNSLIGDDESDRLVDDEDDSEVPRSPNMSHHHHNPHGSADPPPLLIKPLGIVASPSRSSTDGELGAENTDPNASDPGTEGHEECPECHKVFKRKIYLQRHMEREHWSNAKVFRSVQRTGSGAKVFRCNDCNYETKHQSNLSVHRRTHTGERPYHCGACGQRYTQGHLLKSHIRSRHGGHMQFYNLDKKSDSTRGRKSLDIKHDIGGAPHRQDKISTLLAAAAANKSGPQPPKGSPFGGLMPSGMPYMSPLAPYYRLQSSLNPGGVRPMMPNPLALNAGMLGGSRFFGLGGLGGGVRGGLGPNGQSILPKMPQPGATPPSLAALFQPASGAMSQPMKSPGALSVSSLLAAAAVSSSMSLGTNPADLLMKVATANSHAETHLTSALRLGLSSSHHHGVPRPVSPLMARGSPSPLRRGGWEEERRSSAEEQDGMPEDLSVKSGAGQDDREVYSPISSGHGATAEEINDAKQEDATNRNNHNGLVISPNSPQQERNQERIVSSSQQRHRSEVTDSRRSVDREITESKSQDLSRDHVVNHSIHHKLIGDEPTDLSCNNNQPMEKPQPVASPPANMQQQQQQLLTSLNRHKQLLLQHHHQQLQQQLQLQQKMQKDAVKQQEINLRRASTDSQPQFPMPDEEMISSEDDPLQKSISASSEASSSTASNDDASVMQDQYNTDVEESITGDNTNEELWEESSSNRDTASPKDDYAVEDDIVADDHICGSTNEVCAHANQLTKLRKNVMRMLRCFAPEFSENNIDYSTKAVDQLLYDIMFSNIDARAASINSK